MLNFIAVWDEKKLKGLQVSTLQLRTFSKIVYILHHSFVRHVLLLGTIIATGDGVTYYVGSVEHPLMRDDRSKLLFIFSLQLPSSRVLRSYLRVFSMCASFVL